MEVFTIGFVAGFILLSFLAVALVVLIKIFSFMKGGHDQIQLDRSWKENYNTERPWRLK